MYAKTQRDYIYGLRGADKRTSPRTIVTLPILITCSGARHNAVLRNLSMEGALIAVSSPLQNFGDIRFQCGSIAIDAAVLWRSAEGFGIKFAHPLGEHQLRELVARSAAVTSWRERHKRARLLDVAAARSAPWASAA